MSVDGRHVLIMAYHAGIIITSVELNDDLTESSTSSGSLNE